MSQQLSLSAIHVLADVIPESQASEPPTPMTTGSSVYNDDHASILSPITPAPNDPETVHLRNALMEQTTGNIQLLRHVGDQHRAAEDYTQMLFAVNADILEQLKTSITTNQGWAAAYGQQAQDLAVARSLQNPDSMNWHAAYTQQAQELAIARTSLQHPNNAVRAQALRYLTPRQSDIRTLREPGGGLPLRQMGARAFNVLGGPPTLGPSSEVVAAEGAERREAWQRERAGEGGESEADAEEEELSEVQTGKQVRRKYTGGR